MGAPSGTVTFLFTDIEGSTPMWEADEEAMSEAQAVHDRVLHDMIERCGGYVFSTAGDGTAAAFGRAQDALAAAVGAQRALDAQDWPTPVRVRVRMGIHSGEAVERDDTYRGPAVIRAARLMSLVGGGRIACSLATEQLVRDHLPADVELIPAGTAT